MRGTLAAAAITLLLTAGAQAQQAPEGQSAPAPGSAAPPDVVLLDDGGMVRGTISELVPDEHVEVITATGQVRRFEMASVRYAGPRRVFRKHPLLRRRPPMSRRRHRRPRTAKPTRGDHS